MAPGEGGDTAQERLVHCVRVGDTSAVEWLLTHGDVSLNARDAWCVLFCAAWFSSSFFV